MVKNKYSNLANIRKATNMERHDKNLYLIEVVSIISDAFYYRNQNKFDIHVYYKRGNALFGSKYFSTISNLLIYLSTDATTKAVYDIDIKDYKIDICGCVNTNFEIYKDSFYKLIEYINKNKMKYWRNRNVWGNDYKFDALDEVDEYINELLYDIENFLIKKDENN